MVQIEGFIFNLLSSTIFEIILSFTVAILVFVYFNRVLGEETKIPHVCFMLALLTGLSVGAIVLDRYYLVRYCALPFIMPPVLIKLILNWKKKTQAFTYIFLWLLVCAGCLYNMSVSITELWLGFRNSSQLRVEGIGNYYTMMLILAVLLVTYLLFSKWIPAEKMRTIVNAKLTGVTWMYLGLDAVLLILPSLLVLPVMRQGVISNYVKTMYYIELLIRTLLILIFNYVMLFMQENNMKLSDQKENLQHKSTHDPLTGCYNRDAMKAEMEKYLEAMRRRARGTFILIDLDYFKTVNDTLGHPVGDKLLVETAELFRSQFRSDDLIARIGGDEFAIFLPGMDDSEVLRRDLRILTERMKRDIVGPDGTTVRVSGSMGAVICPQFGRDYKTLYNNADKALYSAKEAGRGTFRIYEYV